MEALNFALYPFRSSTSSFSRSVLLSCPFKSQSHSLLCSESSLSASQFHPQYIRYKQLVFSFTPSLNNNRYFFSYFKMKTQALSTLVAFASSISLVSAVCYSSFLLPPSFLYHTDILLRDGLTQLLSDVLETPTIHVLLNKQAVLLGGA